MLLHLQWPTTPDPAAAVAVADNDDDDDDGCDNDGGGGPSSNAPALSWTRHLCKHNGAGSLQ